MELTKSLVDVQWLRANAPDGQAGAGVRIIDLRWYLQGKSAAEEYAKGHIPGAVFLDLNADLTAAEGPGRHPIPSAEKFEETMRKAGVSADTRVVAYDDAGGSIAARLWWLLHHYAHPHASILDGGLPAWLAAGAPLTTEVPRVAPGDFRARPPWTDRVVDKNYVGKAIARGALVLDARSAERFRGDSEPIDARPGHIPGARSAPWAGNLDAGAFKSPNALRSRFAALGADGSREVIVYCGSGVTACHDLLALEVGGLRDARLYEGSWSDWAKDATLPAAKGDE
jgi:thiosulfate/3-mercaptopyruvate sulfurtransferase